MMSEYVFIGKEQDLIDNGFHQRLANFVRSTKEVYGGYVKVAEDNKLSYVLPFSEEKYSFHDGVGSTKRFIKDLIEKGLVKEIRKMTLDDLKIGMVLIDRQGETCVVIEKNGFHTKATRSYHVIDDNYLENLKDNNGNASWDIVKIEYGGKVIWERQEVELTEDEVIVLKALKIIAGNKNDYLARDENNDLYAYQNEPEKQYTTWGDPKYAEGIYLNKNLFQFIMWEDEEPYSIDELLKNAYRTY